MEQLPSQIACSPARLTICNRHSTSRPKNTDKSAARTPELVKKIGTSPSRGLRKRVNSARKTQKSAIKALSKSAKESNLRAVALTLTYSDAGSFSPKNISALLDRLRRVLKQSGHGLRYTWVLERASKLHYHLILWLPRSYLLDLTQLPKLWPWGSTWIEGCRCVTAWGRYMAKFDSATKLPKGARLFGYGGLDEVGKAAVSRAALPRWLLTLLPVGHGARRCPGGGWGDIVTGEIYRSPFVWTPWGFALLPAGLSVSMGA